MSDSKHTPGPWYAEDYTNENGPEFYVIPETNFGTVAKAFTGGNARLIAAAPDLLAALREIETIMTESASACRKRMGTRQGNALVVARAAIAKAEGRS